MPTKTIKPRGTKVKQVVKQSVIVNVRTGGGGRRRVSAQRAPSAMLLKTLLTRPVPPQVITAPQMSAQPTIEQMRDVARQEIMIKDIIEKQAMLMTKLGRPEFKRDEEGVLVQKIGGAEREKAEEELRATQAQMSKAFDEQMKESPFSVKPVMSAPRTPELSPIPEMKVPVMKEPEEEEEEPKVSKEPRIPKTPSAQIIQLQGKRVKKEVIDAYIKKYQLDPAVSANDIINFIELEYNIRRRQRKPKMEESRRVDLEEDEGSSSMFIGKKEWV